MSIGGQGAAQGDFEALRQRAEWHAGHGRLAEARACFEEMLARRPGDAGLLVQLSYIDSLAGGYRRAQDYALQAYEAGSRDPVVNQELAARLRTFNAMPQLQGLVRRLQPLDSVPITLLLALSAQFSYFNDQTTALQLVDEARRGDPEYPPMLLARAQILIYMGRFADAESDLFQTLARAPEIPQTYWLLAQLGRRKPSRAHAEAIIRQLGRPGRKPGEVALLAFALHKELESIGEIEKAWRALQMACAAKRSLLRYSAAETKALVDSLVAMDSGSEPASRGTGRVPMFVVGMHRSGTTLLEQLLDGHSDVKGVGELYDFTSQMRYATDHHCRGVIDDIVVERSREVDFAQVGAGYLAGLEWRLGKERFFTDKLPSNFLNLGFICRALPQAKILHMVRDPVETCFSNLREMFSDANPFSYDQLELADYFKQYRRLMAHWHRSFPGRILDVDYARLTRDPEAVLREVCDFCGLDFQLAMLEVGARTRGVATASAVQVRNRVEARERPKWAPYEEYLQPLIRALRD